MTTETIKVKYDIGFDEGKYQIIKNTIKYGVIGLVVGTILRISIHMFSNNSKVQHMNRV
jgi:hypothetical protein